MLLQKYALILAEGSLCTTNLNHDAAPARIVILWQNN